MIQIDEATESERVRDRNKDSDSDRSSKRYVCARAWQGLARADAEQEAAAHADTRAALDRVTHEVPLAPP